MNITPKNWGTFQHYTNRKPAWIKLHRGLLDDFEFACLPLASRALAPMLWLLASEYEGGEITASVEALAFRFRMSVDELMIALKPLIDSDFFNASELLAECKRDACLEREEEEEDIDKRKRKRETREVALSDGWPSDFENLFWEVWPNPVGKKSALKALACARKRGADWDAIMNGLANYIRDKPPDRQWLNPATFLNQNRWEDQPAKVQNGKTSNVIQAADNLVNILDSFERGASETDAVCSSESAAVIRFLSPRGG